MRLTDWLRPRSGTESTWGIGWRSRWSPAGRCGICGEYAGVHPRCWWLWLTSERVLRGASDGEQQIEPDEPYPSRLRIVLGVTKTLLDPSWYWLCWKERIHPWPL